MFDPHNPFKSMFLNVLVTFFFFMKSKNHGSDILQFWQKKNILYIYVYIYMVMGTPKDSAS